MHFKNVLLNIYVSLPSRHVCQHIICEIDNKINYPVANICVGASCRFRISQEGHVDREVILKSGDLLLYRGHKKHLNHCILKAISDDCPHWMNMSNRLAFSPIGLNEDLQSFNNECA